jgi:SAM-dependent MidA family methyltransferase
MSEASNPLLEIVAKEIEKEGPIPFSRYMELCLYHPRHGYYQRGLTVTGKEGDFYTSPHVHQFFGATIARWIECRCRELQLKDPGLLELGPGNGQLIQDILDLWTADPPDRDFSLTLVEGSPPQREYLSLKFSSVGINVLSPDEWNAVPSFDGIVIANEFFDALPLQIIARADGELKEIYVDLDNGNPRETIVPLDLRQPDSTLTKILETLPEGHRMEVSIGWRDWLKRVAEKLDKGSLVIIDYGDTQEALTTPWRMSGTLRCYSRHTVDTNPYQDPGEKDITAHLNFSLIEDWAVELGFTLDTFTSQSSYLIRAGILDLLAERMEGREGEPEVMKEWLTIKNLIHDEGGMGEIFKVMVLNKNKESEEYLDLVPRPGSFQD